MPCLLAAACLCVCNLYRPVNAGAQVLSPRVGLSSSATSAYGAQVLHLILQHWSLPDDAEGMSAVIVRITADGRPFSCEIKHSSGNLAVDNAICTAVAAAGPFPPPPAGSATSVALSFNYENDQHPAHAAPSMEELMPRRSYADVLRQRAHPYFDMPDGLMEGEYRATAHLMIRQDGSLASCQMERSTGIAQLDSAILRALLHPGVILPPPDGHSQSVHVPFRIRVK